MNARSKMSEVTSAERAASHVWAESEGMELKLHSSADLIFFFFQAEDGIRDVAVTGVQTCALPILERVRQTRGADQEKRAGPPPPRVDQPVDEVEVEVDEPEVVVDAVERAPEPGQIGRASCRERV